MKKEMGNTPSGMAYKAYHPISFFMFEAGRNVIFFVDTMADVKKYALTEETKEFAAHIEYLMQGLEGFSIRPAFGVYFMHFRGKTFGFIMEDYLLIEDGEIARKLLPDLPRGELFPGSKPFVIMRDPGSKGYLISIAEALYPELPIPKPKKRKRKTQEQPKAEEHPFWVKNVKDF